VRIGTIVAPSALTGAIRKVHDFLTVGAPAPLQEAVAIAMEELGPDYYAGMVAAYRRRRDLLVAALRGAGFRCVPPQGAYYVLADYSALSDRDDVAFARGLVTEHGVAAVPASSFHARPDPSRRLVRFAFCKTDDVLVEAARRLASISR
jgi:aminotransferase